MQTIGVSPKLWAAVASALLAHLLTQQLVELPPLADLAIQLAAVGLSVFMAPPGEVTSRRFDDPAGERGQGLVEVAVFLLVVIVALAIAVRFL